MTPPKRQSQDQEKELQQQAYEAGITGAGDIVWKDEVTDVGSLPLTGNEVGDHRIVLADGLPRRRTGTARVLIQILVPDGIPAPRDASGGIMPTATAGIADRWIISVGGTLDIPGIGITPVSAGDYLIWDGLARTYIPNPASNYINSGINNVTVGGLLANSGPFNTTLQAMLDRILYPFSQQTSILTITPSAVFEKGVDQAPLLMTATTVRSTNPTYAITDTVFKRAGATIDTQSGDVTPRTFSVVDPIEDTTVFSIEVTNDNAYTSSNSKTITAVYPMYGGNSVADAYLGWTDLVSIEAVLTDKNVVAKSNQTITDTFTNARNIFMYPASYGVLTSILDGNGFETISNYDMFTQSYTCRDGVSVSYNIYQLKNDTTQTSFSNTYKF